MQITFNQTIATTGECFRRGKTYTLPDSAAATYIANGVAVEAKAQAEKPKATKPKADK